MTEAPHDAVSPSSAVEHASAALTDVRLRTTRQPTTWAHDHQSRFVEFVRAEDWRGLRRYTSENWLALWFSFPIGTLREVLAEVPQRDLQKSPGGAILLVLALQHDADQSTTLGRLTPLLRAAVYAVGNRSVGNVRTSYRRFRPLLAMLGKLQRENSRITDTLYPVLLFQGGLSALYAGEFSVADLWLAQASQFESPAQAPFHHRDVAASRALLNAVFGDAAVADEQLRIARRKPRSDSWVEPGIDAVIDVASGALQGRGDGWELPADLLALPWWHLQPHWPAAVWAVSTELLARGEAARFSRLLDQLELSGIEAHQLSGLFASVIPTACALLHVSESRPIPEEVRARFASQDDPIARFAKLVDAVSREDFDEALQITQSDRHPIDDAVALGLVTGVRATALIESQRQDEAVDLLAAMLRQRTANRAVRLIVLPASVAELIRSEPRLADHSWHVLAIEPQRSDTLLTERERELFTMLTSDRNLRQIATILGRSENTLKTHRRNLYRKLGVHTREELRLLAMQGFTATASSKASAQRA